MAPTTVVSRWQGCNTQSTIPLLARTVTTLGGIGTGRRAVQIRPFRLPPSQSNTKSVGSSKLSRSASTNSNSDNKKVKDEGRNMFVVRSLGAIEKTVVFIEDPMAISRKERESVMLTTTKDVTSTAKDSVKEVERIAPHSKWTHTVLEGIAHSGPIATPFDAFLARVLLGGGTGASASSGSWLSRSTAISIDGFVFSIAGDWEIKIGSVSVKGGSSGANTRGIFVEATYLAVPYLPEGSTFVKDFLTTLFPPPAIASGEIEWTSLSEVEFYEAGLNQEPDLENGEREGEWEWTDEHSFFTYVKILRSEGIL